MRLNAHATLASWLTIGWFAGAIAAQRPVVTVGGPNAQYSDLPAAVAAAPTGAVIAVWPGTYTGFSTQKALRIQLGNATVLPAAGSAYTIQVHNLPPGDAFAIVGGNALLASGVLGVLRLVDNGAPIVLDGITAAAGAAQSALEVQNCPAVLVHHCILAGTPALQVQYASLVSSESIVLSTSGAGAIVNSSLFESTRTSYTSAGMPALRVMDSAVRLSGDGATGMNVVALQAVPVSAFEAINSLVQWDQSRFPLAPAGGAPGFAHVGGTVLPCDVPMLVTSSASPGTVATARISVGTLSPGLIAMGYLSTPGTFGIAGIYLDTVLAPVVAAFGFVDAQGLLVQVNVPNTAVLRGEVFCLQGVVWDTAGMPVLSGPGTWTIL